MAPKSSAPRDPPLLTIAEAPFYLRDVSGLIKGGYRNIMSPYQCLRSLFYLHNQTYNIWTMIVAMICTSLAYYFMSRHFLFLYGSDPALVRFLDAAQEHLRKPLLVLCLSCLIHAPSSIAYHLFLPCPNICQTLRSLDYSLIFACSILLAYALAYLPFYCEPAAFNLTMGLVTACAILNVVFAFSTWFKQAAVGRFARALTCMFLVLCYLIPVFAEMARYSWLEVGSTAFWGVWIVVFLSVSLAVWLARVPEKWFPGVFDNGLHSHALMHVFVLCAHLVEYLFIAQAFKNRMDVGFECSA
eukprot:TRINITY_DN5873_c0_g1_i6.p1 TRINITY_DN5873_c0_g1~~TRINITY_DN5873_c0_g1_i6.p1  ORF type:complete len:300 (+),score=46.75 TRINITY_DN5873_c0_g1_i6:80-979(+)